MNILYILGNGFDKAQGMATSYPEFYQYLNNVKGSPLLEKMKIEISQNVTLWSNMESALGNFTTSTDNPTEFDNLYFELNELLQVYLKSENDKFSPSEELKKKFQDDFITISKYLGFLDKDRYNSYIRKNSFSSKDISVITLNYTDTLEKILDLKIGMKTKVFGANTNLHNIIHVHGQLDSSIIIGVDNENQIKNEKLRNNDDIKDCMIKMQSNLVMKETRHLECEKLINNAHLIIFFGVSLGDTDEYWWKLIGKNLVTRQNLVILQHIYAPGAIQPTQMQKRGRLERQQQYNIMKRMKIEEKHWTEELRKRLFFTVNESVFNA